MSKSKGNRRGNSRVGGSHKPWKERKSRPTIDDGDGSIRSNRKPEIAVNFQPHKFRGGRGF